MAKKASVAIVLACLTGTAMAQDYSGFQGSGGTPGFAGAQTFAGGGDYTGAGSVGSTEPLYPYDDQEKWKHGWLQEMPYYHGYHSFRPYNYHHVYGQSQTAAAAGMPTTMPYSQQWWHRYAQQANLNKSNQFLSAPIPPDTFRTTETEADRIQRQLAEIQSQLNAQKQFHAGSTLGGVPLEPATFGAASYNQPVFVNQVAPTAYQQTIPPQALGPQYVSPNYPVETHATAPAAQKLELLRYMQGGPTLPTR